MKLVYLYPGRLVACVEPTQIKTILGSCVAVALCDRKKNIGGLNHFLMPSTTGGEKQNGRYGEYAINALVEALEKLGSERKDIQAKVYGGGSVLAGVEIGVGIGKRNIEFAINKLSEMRIPVVEKNVGGERSRTVKMRTDTFEVTHAFNSEVDGENELDLSGNRKIKIKNKIRVAIVDDSATVRNLFQNIFTKAGFEVVGTAVDPYAAREMIVKSRPDVLTLDIEMPKMNGVVFLEKLMRHFPMPVIMVSSLGNQGEAALKSLELGAIEFVHKPSQFDPTDLRQLGESLVEKVKAAAHMPLLKKANTNNSSALEMGSTNHSLRSLPIRLIGISGNIGSPESLETILISLANDTPPVVVVNSTISSFLEAYVAKLRKVNKKDLVILKGCMPLRTGSIYFAPPDAHVTIKRNALGFEAEVVTGPPIWGQKPSGDCLFKSMAEVAGEECLALLLSGFGKDGIDGLRSVVNAGGITAAEDPASCAFPLASQTAISLGLAEHVVPSGGVNTLVMSIRNQGVAWTKKSAS